MLELLATTLLDTEPYLILESQNPPAGSVPPNSWGATAPKYDLNCMAWLQSRGEWHGRRPAIFIADKTIPEEPMMLAALAHEVAHVAEAGVDLSEPTPAAIENAKVIEVISLAAAASGTTYTGLPWGGHDWRFVRLAVHTAWRARQLGYDCPNCYLFDHEQYQVAPAETFACALASEPKNMANVSLFDINQFDVFATTEFARLWRACVDEWCESQPADSVAVQVAKRSTQFPERP